MGFLKQSELEYDFKGYKKPKETFVCSNHIDEPVIKKFILDNSSWGKCDYCSDKNRRKVVSLEYLVNFISNGVRAFYGDANDEGMAYESEEGGYWGAPTYNTEELLTDEIGLEVDDKNLLDSIVSCFRDYTWCLKDPYGETESERLSYNWTAFTKVVKHQSRYVFAQSSHFKKGLYNSMVHEILDDIGRRVDQMDLFVELNPATKFFRGRHHNNKVTITSAKHLASPPLINAKYSNRMSPAGISMFYCAFDRKTAQLETVDLSDKTRDRFTCAIFSNKESLYLLDFTKLPKMPSIFDEEKRKLFYSAIFLRNFVSELSQEIKKDGREHIDYVPTQIVTEYFRFTFEEHSHISIDGIIYPSSKNTNKKSCVLFFDHEESLDKLEFQVKSIKKIRV